MTEMVLLADKAHCRFGDKGDTGLFVLIPYASTDFAALVAGVTPRITNILATCQPIKLIAFPVHNSVRSSLSCAKA